MIEKNRTGGFIVSEGNGNISRDEVVIARGAGVLEAGQVLGKKTTGGKFVAYDNLAINGAETAVAILYSQVDATTGDAPAVVIARTAEVKEVELVSLDAGAKADLANNQIIVR